jgi:hypothetical protein
MLPNVVIDVTELKMVPPLMDTKAVLEPAAAETMKLSIMPGA